MSDPLPMSRPTIWQGTHNATSSPGSEGGALPCALPGGVTTALSGRVAALASLSASQAKEQGLLTSGTYGPTGSTLSGQSGLKQSLVSRLTQRSSTGGSTLFKMTWKEKATPSGRSISLLRASAHRTSDSDSGSWPTPKAQDHHTEGKGKFSPVSGESSGDASRMGYANDEGLEGLGGGHQAKVGRHAALRPVAQAGESSELGDSHWSACDWVRCRDNKWRPVEPCTFPLAYGVSNRVGRLRAYGNAIVPQVAAQVIQAYMECRP